MSKARILIVDDEEAIVKYLIHILGRNGYEVFSATDPREAFRKAEELACGLNLLITDIAMPGMNGDELVRNIRRLCPYVSVLAMSGALPASSQGFINCRFLKKPFALDQLLETVKDMLDGQIF